jgi:hypothetical protein
MRVDARQGHYGWQVIDLNTGQPIPLCIWADDETGEYEACVPDAIGQPQLAADGAEILKVKGTTRIHLIPPGGDDADMPIVVQGGGGLKSSGR